MPAGAEGLYLHLLQTGQHKPLTQGRTWPCVKKAECNDNDVVILVDEEDEDNGGFSIEIQMNNLFGIPRYLKIKVSFLFAAETLGDLIWKFTQNCAGRSS